jgi:hypothetical protein
MVDEVVTDVAQRERWSHFQLEATRLRLSAFPLPERFSEVRLADVEDLVERMSRRP